MFQTLTTNFFFLLSFVVLAYHNKEGEKKEINITAPKIKLTKYEIDDSEMNTQRSKEHAC